MKISLRIIPPGRSHLVQSIVAAVVSILLLQHSVSAEPINPNNILVSIRHSIREFTPRGDLVQTITLNYGGRTYPGYPYNSLGETPADIAVDQFGWINIYNGYTNPFLTRYNPRTNAFVHTAVDGWNRQNSYTGGLATFQNFAFATDNGDYTSSIRGIQRFNISTGSVDRIATNNQYDDLNIGLDGKLYGLRSSKGDIDIFDPATALLINHIVKPSNVDWIMGIAADQAGQIYVASRNGVLSRLNPNGTLSTSLATDFSSLTDIDIDQDGKLIACEPNGYVLVGNTSLDPLTFRSFYASDAGAGGQEINVAFAHPVPRPVGRIPQPSPTPVAPPTPIPASDILVSLGSTYLPNEQNSVRQFALDGTLLRAMKFNYGGGSYPGTEVLRDISVDHNGVINAFNGTFNPFLTRFSWECTTFTHRTYPNWNITNQVNSGRIATYQDFVFVTDDKVNLDATGVVRFDTSNNTATRLFSGTQIDGFNVGLDGKLYLFPHSFGAPYFMDAYDPITMQLIKHMTMPSGFGPAPFAVDRNGTIFLINAYGTIFRFDNNFVLQSSKATGFTGLTDLDVDSNGQLVAISSQGWVVVGDTSLNILSWFRASQEWSGLNFFIAFAPKNPQAPVPLLQVVSEKNHDQLGPLDIDLPIDGPHGVECRGVGSKGELNMVFLFARDLVQVKSVCTTSGRVESAMIDPGNPRRFIVNLTGLTNASYARVTLNGIYGVENTYSPTVSEEAGLLLGDSDGNGTVDATDLVQLYQRLGQSVTTANFRSDFNLDGIINAADVTILTSKLNTALPTSP